MRAGRAVLAQARAEVSPEVAAAKKGDGSLPRFYRSVSVERDAHTSAWRVLLDQKALRSPQNHPLRLPTLGLALAIASEWRWQSERRVYTYTMPLMGMAASATDTCEASRQRTRDSLIRHFQTDATCCRSGEGEEGEREQELLDPLLDWSVSIFGDRPTVSYSLAGNEHAPHVTEGALACIKSLNDWQLSAVESLSATTKSLVIALAVAKGYIEPETAVQLTRLEENLQTEHWGIVEGGHDIDLAACRARVLASTCFLRLSDPSYSLLR